jgi:hypothetical protein
VLVDDFDRLLDVLLVDAVRGGVGDPAVNRRYLHEAGELVLVFFCLFPEVVEVDVAIDDLRDDDLHSGQNGGGRVRAVGGNRDQADVSFRVAPAAVVGRDAKQAGELAPCAAVWLQRKCVEFRDCLQPLCREIQLVTCEVFHHDLVAFGLVQGHVGVKLPEAVETHRKLTVKREN